MTGVAAHIYSAAPKGPRGQGPLSQFELSASSNAIWLCETHARLIDNNRGTDYPPAVLISYKGLHEAAIMRRHTGLAAPLGWFHEMQILNGPVFHTPATVRFGKFTILSGDNSTGKTALWEWLSLASTTVWGLNRWRRKFKEDPALDIQVTYFAPNETVLRTSIGHNGRVSYSLNHSPVPYIPLQTRFVVVMHPNDARLSNPEKEAWKNWGDTRRIAKAFQMDEVELVNILPSVGETRCFVQKVWVEDVEPSVTEEEKNEYEPLRNKLRVKLQSHGDFHPSFGMLSRGEQVYVLTEIGVAIARFYAQYVATILIIDPFRSLDSAGQRYWATYLSKPEHLFQTVVEAHLDTKLHEVASSPDFEVIALDGEAPFVEIHQLGATE